MAGRLFLSSPCLISSLRLNIVDFAVILGYIVTSGAWLTWQALILTCLIFWLALIDLLLPLVGFGATCLFEACPAGVKFVLVGNT